MNPRIKWLRNQLLSLKLDGMIVFNPVNIKYLTGLSEEGFLIVAPKENIFVTDSRYIESVNRNLTIDDEIVAYNSRDLSKYDYEAIFMTNENVGFEENYVTYEKYKSLLQTYQVNFVETEGLIENQRIVKDDEEISKIKKACEITDNTFEYITNNLKEGITEREVAFEIERYMIMQGADGTAFESIVAFGENTSMPHAVPTGRKLKKGDIIQFDIGSKYEGYCSDFSRVVFFGEMDSSYKDIYDFVLDEQEKASRALKTGANIKSVVKDREVDYKLKNFEVLHSFGHGVGLDIHELPILRSNQDYMLKENSVIAIEPGVYIPGRFGIRIEDTFIVGKDGCINLTKSSKDYKIIK